MYKRSLFLFLALLPLSLIALVPSTAHAQHVACLQSQFSGVQKHPTSSQRYYFTLADGKRAWFWLTKQRYVYLNDGTTGSWQCQNNNTAVNMTPDAAKLPACIVKLNSLAVTNDPNEYSYNDAKYGKVSLWISNDRYRIIETGQMGNWICSTSGVLTLLGAKEPSVNANNSAGQQDSVLGNNPANQSAVTMTDAPLTVKLKNPLKVDTVQGAISLFMDAVVKIAIPFIVVFFIWAGLKFILAQGKKEEIVKAKRIFWYTIIGTLLILGAWAITDAIIGTINSFSS